MIYIYYKTGLAPVTAKTRQMPRLIRLCLALMPHCWICHNVARKYKVFVFVVMAIRNLKISP